MNQKNLLIIILVVIIIILSGIIGKLLLSEKLSPVSPVSNGQPLTDDSVQSDIQAEIELRQEINDARREIDMQQIAAAMAIYYHENNQYPVQTTMPTSLKRIMSIFPQDPGDGPCSSYLWIPNIGDPQAFCVYACLERGGYFVANQNEDGFSSNPPTSLRDCRTFEE